MSHVRRSRRLSAVLPVTLLAIAAGSFDRFDRSHATEPADRIAASAPPSSTAIIEAGREQFTRRRHTDVAADAGFGSHRLFNARSCAECHKQGGVGGAGPNENNVQSIDSSLTFVEPSFQSVLGRRSDVLPRQSLSTDYLAWRSELLKQFPPRQPASAERPPVRMLGVNGRFLNDPAEVFVPPSEFASSQIDERNTPPLFGLGLIESIPQNVIDVAALTQHEGLRGRSPRLKGGGRGRFGWKASTATLAEFNENACAVELGLTTPGVMPTAVRPAASRRDLPTAIDDMAGSARPSDVPVILFFCPPNRNTLPKGPVPLMRAVPNAFAPPDMSAADVAALTRYVASLPAPRQIVDDPTRTAVAAGERHFRAIGCAVCHTPNLGGVEGLYSDLLLHRIGTRSGGDFYGATLLSGSTPEFDVVAGDEFRTPPLWGVADSAPYLHDGSASTLDAAIRSHAEQALFSNIAYQAVLNPDDRKALLTFLESLRAPR